MANERQLDSKPSKSPDQAGLRTALPGDFVLVRWDKKWAPETGGWSAGVVKEISRGRTKNPNGPGVITRGWSVVEYPGDELHVHLLDEKHHVDFMGDVEMAWRLASVNVRGSHCVDQGFATAVRRERPSRLAYERRRRHNKKLSGVRCGQGGGSAPAEEASSAEYRETAKTTLILAGDRIKAEADDALQCLSEHALDRGTDCLEPDSDQPASGDLHYDAGFTASTPRAQSVSRSFRYCDVDLDSPNTTAPFVANLLPVLPTCSATASDSCYGSCKQQALSFYAEEHFGQEGYDTEEVEDVSSVWQSPAPALCQEPAAGAPRQCGWEQSHCEESRDRASPASVPAGLVEDNYPFHALADTLWGSFDDASSSMTSRNVEYVAGHRRTALEIAHLLQSEGCVLACAQDEIDRDAPSAGGPVVQMHQVRQESMLQQDDDVQGVVEHGLL